MNTKQMTPEEKEKQAELRKKIRNLRRRLIHQAYTDCGMVRVKGNLGGTYYE